MHVIGASLGAAVALELAITAPEKVRSLTLMTPFVSADARLLAVCDAWIQLAAEVGPETLAQTLLPWFFSPIFLNEPRRRARTLRGLATAVGLFAVRYLTNITFVGAGLAGGLSRGSLYLLPAISIRLGSASGRHGDH